jgi:hypothetical protein
MPARKDTYRVLNGWTIYVESIAYAEDELVEMSSADAAAYLADGAIVSATADTDAVEVVQ